MKIPSALSLPAALVRPIRELELPLFPGYLFCRFDVSDRLMPILTTPGVIGIVGAGRTPIPIDEEEIEAVRAILRFRAGSVAVSLLMRRLQGVP